MSNELIDEGVDGIRGRTTSKKPGKRIKFNLPNAQNVYLLGIISIPVTFLYFTGIIFAIMAIVRYNKDLPIYHSDPDKYAKSYEKLRKGYVLSIVSLIISGIFLLLFIILILANIG